MSRWLRSLVAGLIAAVAMAGTGTAQVATDGTVGPRVELGGPDFQIDAGLGARAGGNLFHSFERFSIATGESATFSGPDVVQNVISRVTGGARSDIDGRLASTIPGADFYFLNPAGVLFGPNASLDVQGSFHVSTADELRFADGAIFSATDPSASSLTIAAPEAFGFLGASPGQIAIDRSTLEVPAGATLSIVGGPVTIDGGQDGTASGGRQGLVRAEAGTMSVAGLGGPGALRIADGTATGAAGADITLQGEAHLDTSGEGGGLIRIRGGRLVASERSFVSADNTGSTAAQGGVDVLVDQVIASGGSQIRADVVGSGRGGEVIVQADRIELTEAAEIRSEVRGTGDGRLIQVEADEIAISGFDLAAGRLSNISSEVGIGGGGNAGEVIVRGRILNIDDLGTVSSSTFGSGNAGTVVVAVNEIVLSNGGSIRSDSNVSLSGVAATGDSGSVEVRAETLTILDGGAIATSTFTEGDAGRVIVHAGQLEIDGGGVPSGILSEAGVGILPDGTVVTGTGNAGSVAVTARELDLRNAGTVSSTTFGPGDAGIVTVEADRLLVDNQGAQFVTGIASDAGVFVTGDGQVLAIGEGKAGAVTVRAGELELVNAGVIRSNTAGPGPAGAVTVVADRVLIDGRGSATGLMSETQVFEASDGAVVVGSGRAGSVSLIARDVHIRDAGVVSSATFGPGDAGSVTVVAGRLVITDRGARFVTGVASDSGLFISNDGRPLAVGQGDAGSVTVTADELQILGAGELRSNTLGPGRAGTVTVAAERLLIDGQGSAGGIASETAAEGNAGLIQVTAGELELRRGGRISSITSGAGNAGTVNVEAKGTLTVESAVIASSSFGGGASGSVLVRAEEVALGPGGIIATGSLSGSRPVAGTAGGSVEIVADQIILAGSPDAAAGIFAATLGGENAGNITIMADDLQVSDALITAATLGDAEAGNIVIRIGRLVLGRSAFIESSNLAGLFNADAEGRGGRIHIEATQEVRIEGDANDGPSSGIATFNTTRGVAGRILIESPRITLWGGEISTSSLGFGDAGDIVLLADRLTADRSSISSESTNAGGGGITLRVGDLIDLQDSELTTSIFGDLPGDRAGNIAIDPVFLILDGSAIVARANAGDGGNIAIVAENILRSPDSVIDASSRTGISGTVATSSPEVDLTGGLVVLDVSLLDAAALLRERCAARRDEDASSFTGVGRGGLPPSPDAPLLSDYSLGAGEPGRPEAERGALDDGEARLRGRTPSGGPGTPALVPVALLQPCAGAW